MVRWVAIKANTPFSSSVPESSPVLALDLYVSSSTSISSFTEIRRPLKGLPESLESDIARIFLCTCTDADWLTGQHNHSVVGVRALFGTQPWIDLFSGVRCQLSGHSYCLLVELRHSRHQSRVSMAIPIRFHVDSDADRPVLDSTPSRVA